MYIRFSCPIILVGSVFDFSKHPDVLVNNFILENIEWCMMRWNSSSFVVITRQLQAA
jgi:hypothetical protein